MTLFTMRLCSLTASLYIFKMCNGLKMIWIAAQSVAAKMIYFKSIKNNTDESEIGKLMRSSADANRTPDNGKPSVSVIVNIAGPVPASGLFVFRNVLKEAIYNARSHLPSAKGLMVRGRSYSWLRTPILLLFTGVVSAQTLSVPLPAGCTPIINGTTVFCQGTPPQTCPPGSSGTPPNCTCNPPTVGVPPNCTQPPPPNTIVCPGFSNTLVVTMPWQQPASYAYTSQLGGFQAKGALVVKFTTPANPVPAPTSGKGNWGTVEWSGSPAVRTGSLSLTPCDFTTGLPGPISTAFATTAPTVYFTFGYAKTGFVQLAPNTTYYLNEANEYKGTGTCTNPTCDVKITLTAQPAR